MFAIKKIKNFLFKLVHFLFDVETVYYLGGPATLPPPLEAHEEAKFVALCKKGDESARDALIVHNLRLVVYIARKFDSGGANIEDLISIGTIGLLKAVKTFKADKNIKLATYASRCIENEILMHLRKTNSQKGEISFDEPLNVDWDGNELLLSDVLGSQPDEVNNFVEAKDERKMISDLVENLPKREKEIMQLRFGFSGYSEHTQKEVADKLGISQSYISRLEKKIIAKLKKEVERIV